MESTNCKMTGELRRPPVKKEHVSERLPSFRGKRDLTLGGVTKKTYTPVIPVRKAKPESSPATPSVKGEAKQHRKKKDDRTPKDSKRSKKPRGAGVVASASVFSMGPAEQLMKSGRNASYSSRDGMKSGSSKAGASSFVKHEPMDAVPFLDDDEEGLDGPCDFSYSQYPPIQLPLDPIRHTKQSQLPLKGKQPLKAATTDKKLDCKVEPTTAPPNVAELFTNPGDKAHMLFVQLPDCLPIAGGVQEQPMETDQPANTKPPPTPEACELSQLPTGYLGKIQVHKSGRVKLILGDNSLDVTMGTPCDFQQDLVSIHHEEESDTNPHMVTLGQLSHRLVCVPDLDELLTNTS